MKDEYERIRLFLKKVLDAWRKTKIRCKLHKFFSIRMFTKGDILVLSLIFVFGAVIYQPLWRFIIYIITTDITYFSGRWGLKRLRARLEKVRLLIDTPEVPISRKYIEAVGIVRKSCHYLGSVMDQFNLTQGTAPYLKNLEELIENAKRTENGGEKVNG